MWPSASMPPWTDHLYGFLTNGSEARFYWANRAFRTPFVKTPISGGKEPDLPQSSCSVRFASPRKYWSYVEFAEMSARSNVAIAFAILSGLSRPNAISNID